jgi:hypothetical protein
MSNPNIVNVTTINGVTTAVTPNVATPIVLLANASGSSTVYKVGMISVSNLTTTAQTVTVSVYTNGAQAQNTAPSGGVTFPLAYQLSVPANASLVVTDKTTPFYLNEANSIIVTSGSSSNVTFVTSYEAIS